MLSVTSQSETTFAQLMGEILECASSSGLDLHEVSIVGFGEEVHCSAQRRVQGWWLQFERRVRIFAYWRFDAEFTDRALTVCLGVPGADLNGHTKIDPSPAHKSIQRNGRKEERYRVADWCEEKPCAYLFQEAVQLLLAQTDWLG